MCILMCMYICIYVCMYVHTHITHTYIHTRTLIKLTIIVMKIHSKTIRLERIPLFNTPFMHNKNLRALSLSTLYLVPTPTPSSLACRPACLPPLSPRLASSIDRIDEHYTLYILYIIHYTLYIIHYKIKSVNYILCSLVVYILYTVYVHMYVYVCILNITVHSHSL